MGNVAPFLHFMDGTIPRQLKFEDGIFDITDFGAVGDGVTDDYGAIQSAWNALASHKRGTLFFPFTANGYAIGTKLTFSGDFSSAVRISGELGGVSSGVSGSRLIWIGADSNDYMIDLKGITCVEVDHLDLNANNKSFGCWSCEGDSVTGIGNTCITWTECVAYNYKDGANSHGWGIGSVSGYQCDNLAWTHCTSYAHVGNAQSIGWFVRGGGNTKDMFWDNCRATFCAYGLSWTTPSGASSWSNGGFVTSVACFRLGEASFVIDSVTPETCTGKFLVSEGNVGGASGGIIVRGCQVFMPCAADDIMIDWEAGFLVLEGNAFANLRTVGVTFPKIVINSAAAIAVGNTLGLRSTGNRYLNAPGPYIPVYNEGGALYLSHAVLGPNPGAIQSFGDSGGTAGSPIKLTPLFGVMPDFPQFAAGVLQTSAVGVVSSVAPAQTYTTTNHVDSRTLDETGATLVQLAHVVGTLIKDLQTFMAIK